jgi:rRNA-processing protein EBP2|tara:strand:+ start:751 stop:954 length:204 start_codon:yes stop_codon:yes gene_type:complete
MSYTHKKPLELSEAAKALSINNEIKREVAFYNSARENVMKGMEILVQAKIPIERPDDFFAEMLKTDE